MVAPFGRLLLILLWGAASAACADTSALQQPSTSGQNAVVNEQPQDIPEGSYLPGQLLVKFRHEYTEKQAAAIVEAAGGVVLKSILENKIFLIEYPARWSIHDAITHFQAVPEIEWAEPNYIRRHYPRSPPATNGPAVE